MKILRIKNLVFILLALFLITGCASKRYAKKGAAFEQAGLYEKAADMYYASVKKNPKNVEATIGLKKNGQLTLDKKLGNFLNAYNADNRKDAVYNYLDATAYRKKLGSLGVELVFPSHYQDYYNEVKEVYLEERYNEAYLLLEDEEFTKSEVILKEILMIDPNYEDASNMLNTAHYEPIYRKGKEYLTVKKYRTAYNKFQLILTKIPNYKDTKELSDEALQNALITIAIVSFGNKSSVPNAATLLESSVEKSLTEVNSPFIKLVDQKNTERIQSEQLLSLEGSVNQKVSIEAGKMYGVKALLTGEVKQMTVDQGKLKKEVKKGYLKEKVVEKVNGEDKTKFVYHKTNYFEYSQQRKVSCSFQFRLISAETGEILVSDAINLIKEDAIDYAEYSGDNKKLIPGDWERKDKDLPADSVDDSTTSKRQLDNLLNANKQIKSVQVLTQELNVEIAQRVAKKIKDYDPEN